MTKASQKKPQRRGLPRRALDQELVNLTERLQSQLRLANAIAAVNIPNGEHTHIEHQLRTVFGVQIEALRRGLDGVHTLARAMCGSR